MEGTEDQLEEEKENMKYMNASEAEMSPSWLIF